MHAIRFYGSLERFGSEFNLEVTTAGEAIKALMHQVKGLSDKLRRGYYKVRISEKYLTTETLEKGLHQELTDGDTIHLIPTVKGAGGKVQAIAGAVLIGAAILAGPIGLGLIGASTAMLAGAVGASMLLGGVAQMMIKPPSMPNPTESAEGKSKTTSFSSLGNFAVDGQPCPLAYGEILTGSVVISRGITTRDRGE